jgi:hypothetical protein
MGLKRLPCGTLPDRKQAFQRFFLYSFPRFLGAGYSPI